MKTLLPIAIAAAALAAASTVHAADLAAGQAKAKEVCAACHGLDGNSPTPDYPRLAGQYPDYLAKALRDYKSGRRKNPIMAGFAGALSKSDIENLAAYYAAQPPVLRHGTPSVVAAPGK
jgi:cytochrome c553